MHWERYIANSQVHYLDRILIYSLRKNDLRLSNYGGHPILKVQG